jgi:chaperonin cofactor prefoldin
MKNTTKNFHNRLQQAEELLNFRTSVFNQQSDKTKSKQKKEQQKLYQNKKPPQLKRIKMPIRQRDSIIQILIL